VLERGYYIETSQRGLRRLGFSRSQEKLLPALVIPRYSPSGAEIPPQIKPDNPRTETADGRRRKHIKYETPGGVDVRLSVPPRCVPAMRDATTPLYKIQRAIRRPTLSRPRVYRP
jgi:hypothetical protein